MHKIKALVSIITLSLIISLFIVNMNTINLKATGRDIYVDDDQNYPDEADGSLYNPYKTIQAAIKNAENGDTIKVLAGKYTGDIVIDKSITIITESIEKVYINSSKKSPYFIDILADSVALERLSLEDSVTTSHRRAIIHISSDASGVKVIDSLINHSNNGYGIFIEDSYGTVIRNNTINDTRGIYIGNSNLITIDDNRVLNCSNNPSIKIATSIGNHIVNNYVDNSTYGIYASECSNTLIEDNKIAFNEISGTLIVSGNENEIYNNTIVNNNLIGIDLSGDYCTVGRNIIRRNGIGISIGGSNSIVKDNHIKYALNTGVYARPGSKGNTIFNNTFRENSVLNAEEEGNNNWDNGYIGNWWDDFYGPDPSNLNNTVEYDNVNVPNIYKYKKNGVCDNYPIGKYHIQPVVLNPNPEDEVSGVNRNPLLSVEVEDPDPGFYTERLDVYFYYILNDTYNLIGKKSNIESGGTASIPFSSTIEGKTTTYTYKGLGYDYIGVWYAEVEDSYSRVRSPIWIFTTINTPINNKKPIADISVPSNFISGDEIYAQVNDSINFDASPSYDPDGEIIFYKWTFPPDTSIINKDSYAHSFKKEGTYTINLVVIDNDGSSNSINTSVNIRSSSNRPPVAVSNGHYSGKKGKTITFDGSGSYDPDNGDTISTEWTFGDGDFEAGMITYHVYKKPGNYTVTFTVTDQNGESDTIVTYAVIKDKKEEGMPGFEITFLFIAIFLTLNYNKRKRNKKI
jgi:parallel beta-helix repeat protein